MSALNFEFGARVEHVRYGLATAVEHTSAGVRVRFDVPPAELDDEAEDVVAAADLIEASPYSPEQTFKIIDKQLRLLFSAGDWACFTYIHPTKKTKTGSAVTKNKILPFAEAVSSSNIEKLIERNREWNCYVAQNPLIEGATQRIKESVGSVRHVFCEVDDDGEQCLAAIRASAAAGEIPTPSAVAQSSSGKYQFVWRINSADFDTAKVEQVNSALVSKFGSDPACTDVLRVFRVWGLRNHKYPQHPVVRLIEADAAGCYGFTDFKIPIAEEKTAVVKPAAEESELVSIVEYFEKAASEANLSISPLKKWGNSGFLWEITCPWVSEHTGQKDSGTVVILHKSGALDFTCRHGHCAERTWPKDFRPKMEELAGHPLRFGDSGEHNVILAGTETVPSTATKQTAEERAKALFDPAVVDLPEEEADEDEPDINALERAGLPIVLYPDPGNDDFVSIFAKDLVSGSSIPLAYAREPLKYMTNHILDGHYFHPAYMGLVLRGNHFSLGESETGKTKGFDFVKEWMFTEFVNRGILMKKLLAYKSEALFVKSLSTEKDKQGLCGNPNQFLYVTEGAEIAAKKNNDNFQEVFAKIIELYDQDEAETGSFTNGRWHARDIKISTFLCFTWDSFRQTYGGKGSIGSGGLGRYSIACPPPVYLEKDWTRLSNADLRERFRPLQARLPQAGASTAIMLTEDPRATEIRLQAKKRFLETGKLGKRIMELFFREQVNRAVMSVHHPNIMSVEDAERIVQWADSVVEARRQSWPVDAGNNVEMMEVAIRRQVFEGKHCVSEKKLKDACNYYRPGSGGAWAFNSALKNLKTRDIKWSGLSRKRTPLYCPKTCRKHPDLDALTPQALKDLLAKESA